MRRLAITVIALAGTMTIGPVSGFAMGDDPAPSNPKKTCKQGYVYSKKKKRCVRENLKLVPDRELIEQGWALAYEGNFERARDVFKLVDYKQNPMALNGLGYTHRKLGQLERGIGFYKLALAIDPDYLLAREYLGEGYVMAGRIDLAKAQLSQIKQRCGTSCKEYRMLARAISTGSENDW